MVRALSEYQSVNLEEIKLSQQFRTRTIILTALSLLVFVALLLNSTLFFTRLDLTESRAYSISRVSRELFREIDNQVHIDYYLSDRLRSRTAEVEQISDILYQYAAFSRGKIRVNVIDPAAAGISQQVEASGVTPRQIQVIEENQQSLAVVYSGIVINYLDRFEVLPFVLQPSSIEYQLTSTIKNLLADTARSIAILVGDERKSLEQNYGTIRNQLSQFFDLRQVFPGERVPANAATLIVLGATALDKDDLYPIDQYVMNGGKVFLAIDAVNVNVDLSFYAYKLGALPIFDMLEHYGVAIEQHLVADTYNLRIPMQQSGGGDVVIQTLVSYPYWITVLGGSVDAQHPLTARFAGLDLFWASPIKILDTTPGRITPLVYSSPESWSVTEEPFNAEPNQALALEILSDEVPRTDYPLGVIIQGSFESYFDDIPDSYQAEEDPIDYTASVRDTRMVILSDTDFVGPVAQYTQSVHNYTFFQDVVGYLADDDELLTIRTRVNRDVRLNAIPDPIRRLTVASRAALVNVFIIPLGVALFGIIRFFRRRKSTAPVLNQDTPSQFTQSPVTSKVPPSARSSRGKSRKK